MVNPNVVGFWRVLFDSNIIIVCVEDLVGLLWLA